MELEIRIASYDDASPSVPTTHVFSIPYESERVIVVHRADGPPVVTGIMTNRSLSIPGRIRPTEIPELVAAARCAAVPRGTAGF